MIGLDPPARAIAMLRAIDRLGQLGGAIAIAAIRHGDRVGVHDELGTLTFAELHARSDALTCALRARGLREGDGIGILCRNHRGFIDITFGAAKLGARVLYLNTDFAGPTAARRVRARGDLAARPRRGVRRSSSRRSRRRHGRLLGWTDGPPPEDSLERLIAALRSARRRRRRPSRPRSCC